ncbi:NAD(P)/FAD-dependent oxidoreductase [Herbiconiux sp. CPCC 205716]|uniref:NAD(P)/FAD-dependent oxidoreductase n=1 Tax=Herbiconiux gentiana TaxID=2970912 RepID=A0ABT2GM07_9MICO|nr:NAD(P)/FAD-dependent oxidoreductase [Herbiconiux gentiana]MCS5716295.1 NAD(P)/FAD-dependent oxidoreductase [Herbiconiux gentiana]
MRGYDGDAYEVIVIGGGPAGLSVGLNLVRARRRVLILDSNRPRHSATLISHGFITRDGVSPLELRALGREEFAGYPTAEFHQGLVTTITPGAAADSATATGGAPLFTVTSRGVRGSADRTVTAPVVVLTHGLAETLPALPSIRAYYGTALHSCLACDLFEKSDQPLALIGESADLAERALLVSQVTDDLIVFTNDAPDAVTAAEEAALAARGIAVERRPIDDLEGDRSGLTGVRLADGTVVPRTGGFVRPTWTVPDAHLAELTGLERDADGHLVVDALGATSVPGLYAAGDLTPPGPQQLIVAAGAGARTAAAVARRLLGPL